MNYLLNHMPVILAMTTISLVSSQYQAQQQPGYGQQVPQQYQQQQQPQAVQAQGIGHPHQPAYGQGMAAPPGQVTGAQLISHPQGHGPPVGHAQPGQPNMLHDKSRITDKEHLKEHLGAMMNEPDLSKMSDEEVQFHYFKIHDNDNNNQLDGSELIKSLIHWHVEENKQLGANAHPHGTTKIFTDEELATMIDPILETDDQNKDGYIDYPEFVAAQKSRGF